jgi:hypothetical protein
MKLPLLQCTSPERHFSDMARCLLFDRFRGQCGHSASGDERHDHSRALLNMNRSRIGAGRLVNVLLEQKRDSLSPQAGKGRSALQRRCWT